ncbi:MAG: right-handed parallel beta-helix repeat-containing protein [Ignavibacteriaceae bacterium]|nr:right-handed parallel beta-helix repeat-containing protein [Ignavibacteriaceae bacterium]
MIPGLSLIGSGMDSCIINTRELVNAIDYKSVTIAHSCKITGFNIKVNNNSDRGFGISVAEGSSINWIYQNKLTMGGIGIFINNVDTSNKSNINIYKNLIDNFSQGVHLFNSNAIIKENNIFTDPNSQGVGKAGIFIESYFFNYTPVIDSNYIEATSASGIRKSFGSRTINTNNIIKLKPNSTNADGITLSTSDSATVSNNVIISEDGVDGIYNSGVQYLRLYNNYVTGIFLYYPLMVGPNNAAINNAIIKANGKIRAWGTTNLEFKYNNVFGNNVSYVGLTPDSTNLSVDPMVVRDYGNIDSLNFHLQKYSPMIDAGDPSILDRDGSRSDIGLYGGPLGELYTYLDFAPRPPQNFSAIVDTITIML